MPNISKIMNSDGVSYNIKDNEASHYLGRLNSDEVPTTTTITLDGESTSITAKINDWIVLKTKSDAFIWNGTEWMSFGGRGTDALVELVDNGAKNLLNIAETSNNYHATPVITTLTGTVTITSSGTWARSAFPITLPSGNYVFSSTVTLPSGSCEIRFSRTVQGSGEDLIAPSVSVQESGSYTGNITLMESTSFYIMLYNNPSTDSDTRTITYADLMICSKAEWDISHKFVPYAMNNAELSQSVIPRLVNAEAKNLLNLLTPTNLNRMSITDDGNGSVTASCSNVTWANSGYEFSLTVGKTYKFIIYVDSTSVSDVQFQCFVNDISGSTAQELARTSRITSPGVYSVDFVATTKIRASINLNNSGTAATGSATYHAMLCTMEDYNVSPEFVQYAKSNYELTQVTEPIPRLVDDGAKNVLNLNTSFTTHTYRGITYTNNHDGTILVDGTSTASDSYATLYDRNIDNLFGFHIGETVVIASTSDNVSINLIPKKAEGGYGLTVYGYKSSLAVYTIPANFSGFLLRVGVPKSGTSVNNESVNGMICSFKDYTISPAFVPYAKTNRELTTLSTEDRASLVELVDSGAKNIAVPLDVASREDLTITNDNGQYTMTGTITRSFTGYLFRPAEPLQLTTDCIIIGAEQLTGLRYLVAYRKTAESEMRYDIIGTQNKILPSGAVISYIYAQQDNAGTAISAKINLMLCTVADYAISPKFVPYAPTNRELYETKVDTSELHAFLPNITSSTTIRDYVDSLSKGVYTAFIANASNPSDSPINANCFVNIYVYSTTTAAVELIPIANAEASRTYTMRKIVGTWGSWYKFEGTVVA